VNTEENQAVPISADDEVNHAIVDLVGDIAGYRPGNKVVIFESSESASFDASMTKGCFPNLAIKSTLFQATTSPVSDSYMRR